MQKRKDDSKELGITDFMFTPEDTFSLLGEHNYSLKLAFWKISLRKK